MALRRTCAFPRSEAPSETSSTLLLGHMLSFRPLLCPSPLRAFPRIFPRFQRGNSRPSSPLKHASLASEPSPPAHLPFSFHFSTTWATRVLFVQVPPRSCAEFHCAASADTRGHYPSPRLRCLGFFPPLHFLLQASRFCLMLGYRCLRSSVSCAFLRIFPRPKRGYARTHLSLPSSSSWPCHLPPSPPSYFKICVTLGCIGLMFVQVFPRAPWVFPAL